MFSQVLLQILLEFKNMLFASHAKSSRQQVSLERLHLKKGKLLDIC